MVNKTQLPQETVEKILDFYCNKQYGQQKVAKLTGVSISSIRKTLVENHVHIRSFSEAAKASAQYRRKYEVNDKYFDKQTKNSVYLLGFIAADGTVSKDSNQIKIGLSSVDKEFLEAINRELQNEHPVFSYETDNGYQVSELKLTSKRIKDELAKYNIIPRKTYSFEFPDLIDKQFYLDFIRGYFDGDGSVSTAGPNAIRFQICSNRPGVLNKIVDILYSYGIEKVSVQSQQRAGGPLYYIQYSTSATRKIYDLLYYPNCFCLPRKYEKYTKLVMK